MNNSAPATAVVTPTQIFLYEAIPGLNAAIELVSDHGVRVWGNNLSGSFIQSTSGEENTEAGIQLLKETLGIEPPTGPIGELQDLGIPLGVWGPLPLEIRKVGRLAYGLTPSALNRNELMKHFRFLVRKEFKDKELPGDVEFSVTPNWKIVWTTKSTFAPVKVAA